MTEATAVRLPGEYLDQLVKILLQFSRREFDSAKIAREENIPNDSMDDIGLDDCGEIFGTFFALMNDA